MTTKPPLDAAGLEALARKALRCLYIAVEKPIADDVNAKVGAALDAQASELRRALAEIERLQGEVVTLRRTLRVAATSYRQGQ